MQKHELLEIDKLRVATTHGLNSTHHIAFSFLEHFISHVEKATHQTARTYPVTKTISLNVITHKNEQLTRSTPT